MLFLAEREGFEPPEPRSSTVFKTAVIDHSTTSPNLFPQLREYKGIYFFLFCKICWNNFAKNSIMILFRAYSVIGDIPLGT